jgi:hypothetical protein
VTPESLTAALRDDSAGWRAWSDAARTAGSLFNEGAPSTIYESLQDPLSRRLRQHEGGETWSAFAHATPFAFALASLRKFASLDSHLALVAKRARAARSSGSADAPEWSLYQCELTQMVTVFGHPQAVRPLADSLRESKAEQMLVEAPEWFGCLAALSWDSGVERRLGAWLSPDGKLPEKTDFAELATALGRHALASETLRKHVLWGLSNTARQDGQTLRICDLYANALEALSGAPRAREGSAQLKRWLESQPLRPPREPEPLLP